ncbi:MAG: PDZ domain-containing protein [Armatimonadetes bacterium]|nr:PDZ domain-containing protein [Armatimonadota bacterium]
MFVRRVLPLLVAAFVATASFAQSLTAEQKDNVLKSIQETLSTRAFVPGVDFSKWTEFIDQKKDEIAKDEDVNSFTRTVNQALREFGISHCRLQTPRATTQRGKTTTTGTGFLGTVEEKGLRVRRVIDGSPAKEAGIEEKDLILKVNGEKPTSASIGDGQKGAKFDIEVEKPDGSVKQVSLELKEFSTVRKETLTWEGDDAAVLRLATFSFGYDRDNIDSLIAEANKKAKYLIIDLRSNGGGAVNNLNHFLSLLLPENTDYGTFLSRRVVEEYTKAKPDGATTPEAMAEWAPRKAKTRKGKVDPFKGKIAVLINRGSASASEICTAALKENVDAKVIGTRSAGAVLSSVFTKLTEGFSIQIPVSDYVTIKGVRLEANPIQPDVEVTAVRKDNEPDPVIAKALETLRGSR